MQTCPHCQSEIELKELPHQGLCKSYRLCPHCGGRFTVDKDTTYRQALFIVIALIALLFTLLLYYGDHSWMLPALASYAALTGLIYWGNKKVCFVPCNEDSEQQKPPRR